MKVERSEESNAAVEIWTLITGARLFEECIMYRSLWSQIQPSVCGITFFLNGERIASGTGFKIGKKIITNNHVIQVSSATHASIRFVSDDGHSIVAAKSFSMPAFRALLQDGEPDTGWDFAILDASAAEFAAVPSLTLREKDDVKIGSSIALFGFQFDQQNLSIHTGTLASKYVQASVHYLQIDASVNHGNSGGPLVIAETGEVIGIVTRKATGLSKQFDELIASFANNMQVLTAAKGGVRLSGIDPMEVLAITQQQMGQVAIEIQRSANVGIGYAYELQRVRDSLRLLA